MHPSVREFAQRILTADMVTRKRVLEVGSYDVNGTVRPDVMALDPAQYLGVDASEGPSVDLVVDCEHLVTTVGNDWDLVISTEMLEHVRDWQACLTQLIEAVRTGGMLLLTTRSPGFPFHPFPEDHWRFPVSAMLAIVVAADLEPVIVEDDWQAPGVMVLAKKPVGWAWPFGRQEAWDNAGVSNEAR